MRRALLLAAVAGTVACQAPNPAYVPPHGEPLQRDAAPDGARPIDVATVDLATVPPDLTAATRGLKGEYFDTMSLTELKATRVDPTIDFDWALAAPAPGVAVDSFSVRWTGTIRASTSETYTIFVESDDGVRVWIDDQPLIAWWFERSLQESSGRFTFQAGRVYTIRIEYFESTLHATIRLRWSSASVPKQLVPSTALAPP